MIVVIGSPAAQSGRAGIEPAGVPAAIAIAAAGLGGSVQLVGRVGEDAAGDVVLLALAAAGVGHVAVLREATHSTPSVVPGAGTTPAPDGPDLAGPMLEIDDPHDSVPEAPAGLSMDAGDLDLALRYLPDYRVVIVADELPTPALETVVGAARWAGAHLIALVLDAAAGRDLPADATILVRPGSDPDGTFARFVADFAVGLDGGRTPEDAFSSASGGGGWVPVSN